LLNICESFQNSSNHSLKLFDSLKFIKDKIRRKANFKKMLVENDLQIFEHMCPNMIIFRGQTQYLSLIQILNEESINFIVECVLDY
jgi:hypothetical protein